MAPRESLEVGGDAAGKGRGFKSWERGRGTLKKRRGGQRQGHFGRAREGGSITGTMPAGVTTDEAAGPIEVRGAEEQVLLNAKRTREMFAANYGARVADVEEPRKLRVAVKVRDEYNVVKDLPPPPHVAAAAAKDEVVAEGNDAKVHLKAKALADIHNLDKPRKREGQEGESASSPGGLQLQVIKKKEAGGGMGQQLMVRKGKGPVMPRPEWHAPWKLMRVISGHLGWVRCCAVDPTNEWFVTGAGDRTIKLWDLASGELKLTLTGHISPVRGVAVSDRHPYMFRSDFLHMLDQQTSPPRRAWAAWEVRTVLQHALAPPSPSGPLMSSSSSPPAPPFLCSRTLCRPPQTQSPNPNPPRPTPRPSGRTAKPSAACARTRSRCAGICAGTSRPHTASPKPQTPHGSVGEDKLVKCWDLETNSVIRHYHGHLSGVYCCALHPTLDVLCTGGRDSSVRVWDIRTKQQIFCLAGHKDTVGSVVCQATDPQIISGSQDSTVLIPFSTSLLHSFLLFLPPPSPP